MSLTRKQQGMFRPLVDQAWKAHCARHATGPEPEQPLQSRDDWYRDQLEAAVGVRSTKNMKPADDFAGLMAHFEQLVDDGSTYWQQRAAEEDDRRLRWLISDRINRGEVLDGYVAGIANNMFGTRKWRELPADHLRKILVALDKHLRRHA